MSVIQATDTALFIRTDLRKKCIRFYLLSIITFCRSKLTANLCSYFGLQHFLGQTHISI